MKIKIITHERVLYDGEAEKVIARDTQGEFEILQNHVPCMKVLATCAIQIFNGGECFKFATMGGILQLKDNEILVLTDIAESGKEIDIERAKAALSRAEHRLKEMSAETDAKRAEAAKARALARLKASLEI